MPQIYRLYNDILSKLPFSINGYSNVMGKIDEFFNVLAKNSYFLENRNLKFVSYTYCKLTNIESWEVENWGDSKFFFHSYNESHSEIILDLYYQLKDIKLLKRENNTSQPTAQLISKIFIRDTSYRVKGTTDSELTFLYDLPNHLFEIQIPYEKIWKLTSSLNDKEKYIKNEFYKYILLFIKSLENGKGGMQKKYNVYEKRNIKEVCKEYTEAKELFFNSMLTSNEELNELCNEIATHFYTFHKNNNVFFNPTSTYNDFIDFSYTVISVAFLSNILNCWLEYIPSTAGVQFRENGNPKYLYRSLGAFIVGYTNDGISQEERTVFKLIADRIGSVVAAQNIYDKYESNIKLFGVNLKNFVERLDEKALDTDIHWGHPESLFHKLNDEFTFWREFERNILEFMKNILFQHPELKGSWILIEKIIKDKDINGLEKKIRETQGKIVTGKAFNNNFETFPMAFWKDDWELFETVIKHNRKRHGNKQEETEDLEISYQLKDGIIQFSFKTDNSPMGEDDISRIQNIIENCKESKQIKKEKITGLTNVVTSLYNGWIDLKSVDNKSYETLLSISSLGTKLNKTINSLNIDNPTTGTWYMLNFNYNQ